MPSEDEETLDHVLERIAARQAANVASCIERFGSYPPPVEALIPYLEAQIQENSQEGFMPAINAANALVLALRRRAGRDRHESARPDPQAPD